MNDGWPLRTSIARPRAARGRAGPGPLRPGAGPDRPRGLRDDVAGQLLPVDRGARGRGARRPRRRRLRPGGRMHGLSLRALPGRGADPVRPRGARAGDRRRHAVEGARLGRPLDLHPVRRRRGGRRPVGRRCARRAHGGHRARRRRRAGRRPLRARARPVRPLPQDERQ